ncbi:MAG: YggT family protein [Betaproteobacteria bacterium]|nr:YggT family protein [Betaproteobacteria bacterium]
MLSQIGQLLIDAVAGLFVLLLLARFHFQWLRVSFRNQVGAFVIALTNWIVMPARRIIPALAGLDLATLIAAWLLQALALFLTLALIGREPGSVEGFAALGGVAAIDLARYSLYILIFALLVQAVLSWVNPYSPVGPMFDALTRPFLRPLRRIVPPVANVDLTPLVLIILLQVVLIPLAYAKALVAGLA